MAAKAAEKSLELRADVPDDCPEALVGDVTRVRQILVNLVKNSLDALDGAGKEHGIINIQVDVVEEEVVVSVSDNGPGVSAGDRDQLFEAFFTTKPKGVGLGLSICKSIAAAHGGSLKYSAEEGGGSRFSLSLPLGSIG